MLTEDILEELRNTRNIALTGPEPDEDFLKLVEEILENDNETASEFEDFLREPELEEREKEAQFIIRQLKIFYKAKRAEIYEREDDSSLMIRMPGSTCWVKVTADAAFSRVTMKAILPVLAGQECFGRLAPVLHSFNEDPDVEYGFFHLDDGSGEISCIYRYSFAGGSFTEEGFHRYFRSVQKMARAYLGTIQMMVR